MEKNTSLKFDAQNQMSLALRHGGMVRSNFFEALQLWIRQFHRHLEFHGIETNHLTQIKPTPFDEKVIKIQHESLTQSGFWTYFMECA